MTDARTPSIEIALLGDDGAAAPAATPAIAGVDGRTTEAAAPADAGKTNIFDFDRARLERFFEDELGEKKFRAHQVMKRIQHP
jgi:23S rRNA (adenine2503-C2)-methyltransferase